MKMEKVYFAPDRTWVKGNPNAQVNSDTCVAVSTATGSCVMTVGQFVVEYGIPTLDRNHPKCHFQNGTDVTLFKMQLAEQGLVTVPGFEIKLAK